MTIDVHTHILPPGWPDLGERCPRFERIDAQTARIVVAGRNFRDITDQCWVPERRLADMDRDGVERQVLSTVPVMFSYWAPPAMALSLCRHLNDHIAGVVAAHPRRFVGLATVPLQDPALAVAELRRAVTELGLRGVEIGSNVNGQDLDAPALFPFFEAAAALGTAVFVHPWQMVGGERLERYYLGWLVGMPAETSLAIASVVFGGLLDRLPALRIGFAHGGGTLPYIAARLDRGWQVRPECRAAIPRPPSEYLPRLWFDSLTHDPEALRFLLGRAGAGRVMLGTDYPFAMGEAEPGATIRKTATSEAEQQALLAGTARAFLGLG
jgi:aminocarboxymuconate-semialdehyde decarboxylase